MRECGRSMVEMLGVLAIIGVLSVGAISGYSKAMMKYKLNKFSESYNILLNYALQYTPQLETSGTQTSYDEILYKLNLIPDGMIYEAPRIYDIFRNKVSVYRNTSDSGSSYNVLALYIEQNDYGKQICQSALVTAKENAAQIYRVSMKDEEFGGDGGNDAYSGYLYGDKECNGTRRCLRNLTISDIADICGFCDTAVYQCKIMVIWQD